MNGYRIGPLLLQSSMVIPELPLFARAVAAGHWTFRVTRGRRIRSDGVSWFHEWTLPDGKHWLAIGRVGGAYLVRFNRIASFLVDPSMRTIVAYPNRHLPARTLRHLLLDQIVPMLLGDADHLVVHASAVAADGGAIAFIGPSGSGKSTLAAALARRGGSLVTDDCLVVDLKRQPAYVIPTYAGVRLWPDALKALFPVENQPPARVAHYSPKRRIGRHPDDLAFRRRPQPLRAACLLAGPADHRSPSLSRLQGHEAFAAVLRCTFHLDVGRKTTSRRTLDRVTTMLETVPVFRLHVPRDLTRLDEVETLLRSLTAA